MLASRIKRAVRTLSLILLTWLPSIVSGQPAPHDPAAPLVSEQITLTAISTDAVASSSCGPAEFRVGATVLYREFGCGGRGRGFNVAVIDPLSGDVIGPIRNFDTYSDTNLGGNGAFNAMVAFLGSSPMVR